VAESVDHFLSIRVNGSEATGMIFNPAVPTEFVVAVQHPSSTDLAKVPNGLGDAVWSFNVSGAPDAAGYLKALAKGKFNTNQ
jgi:secreted PhoX family phosphatase